MCSHLLNIAAHCNISCLYLMINCTFSDVFGPKINNLSLQQCLQNLLKNVLLVDLHTVKILKNTELILFCLLFQVCKTYFWSIFDRIIVKNHSSMPIVYGQNQKVSFIYFFFVWLCIGFINSMLNSDLNQRFDYGKADIPTFTFLHKHLEIKIRISLVFES